MIDIGINYIKDNEECYKILKKYNIINTIKFPGKVCNIEELQNFLKFSKENNLKIDLHGLPKMKPSFSCNNDVFIGNIDFNFLNDVFKINKSINRISTHMGLDNMDRLSNYTQIQLDNNWKANYLSLKSNLEGILEKNIQIGLENIAGGFDYDIKTLTPEYASENWKMADFGVFDITHAKLASEQLNISYKNYLEKIKNTEKVKILHVSGNFSDSEQYKIKPDKHVLISTQEIEDIVDAINRFKYLDLVVSEYAYNSKYSSKKETIIEAVTINKIVSTNDAEIAKSIFKYLSENLNDDIANVDEILSSC